MSQLPLAVSSSDISSHTNHNLYRAYSQSGSNASGGSLGNVHRTYPSTTTSSASYRNTPLRSQLGLVHPVQNAPRQANTPCQATTRCPWNVPRQLNAQTFDQIPHGTSRVIGARQTRRIFNASRIAWKRQSPTPAPCFAYLSPRSYQHAYACIPSRTSSEHSFRGISGK